MKRKITIVDDNKANKMARINAIEYENESSFTVTSKKDMNKSLAQYFAYELSDKKAKANLLKNATREAFVIDEKQKCSMLLFSVGSYKEAVLPTVDEWKYSIKEKIQLENFEISVEEMRPAYDENEKLMETLVRFNVNGHKISVTCFNSTQKIKVEGKGYLEFVSRCLKPLFLERIRRVSLSPIEQYNKEVIASLTGKRKAVSRPMRSVKYKAMGKLPCLRCENNFTNSTQLRSHMKRNHSVNNSSLNITNIPMLDNISLLELSCDQETAPKHITLEEETHADLKEHKQNEHDVTNTILLQCISCGTKFSSAEEMNKHIKHEHEKQEVFECELCNIVFPNTGDLQNHKQN